MLIFLWSTAFAVATLVLGYRLGVGEQRRRCGCEVARRRALDDWKREIAPWRSEMEAWRRLCAQAKAEKATR